MRLKSTFTTLFLLAALLLSLAPAPQPVAAASTCDWAQFVADVTIPDGTVFRAGDSFNKTWRLKNVGSCTWNTSYSLVFVSGAQMSAPASINLPKSVAPGATVDVTVSMTAPNNAGTYRGNWQLKNASGVLFGIGAAANKPFWVEVKVSGTGGSTGYDFVDNAASAAWASGAGSLNFPGSAGDAKGFVKKLDTPKLENGTFDSAPGLLMAPQNVYNGYIQGSFPAYTVARGDHFQAIVNCEYGAASCWANFQLRYQVGSGAPVVFWSFNEKYDGLFYRVNLDLSPLAGKSVKFILRVNAAGAAAGDRALWGAPRIVTGGPASPSPTPAITGTPPTPTVTPTITPGSSNCDKVLFVADVNVPDGTIFGPNTNFTKTWRIKNVGTCTWTTNYSLVFVSGEKLGGPDAVKFTSTIAPNTTFDISVNLTSPGANGSYRGYWQFKNDKGQLFGIGSTYNKPFWVDIKVQNGVTPVVTNTPGPTTTPVSGGADFDFADYASTASWSSGVGALSFPGTDKDAKGFVLPLESVKMETGNTDTRRALLTVPQNVYSGYIQGLYLPVKVGKGDRFQATIGCQYGASNCYVTYQLNYQIGSGAVQKFWTFNEKYDGMVYNVNLDLSSLAGQDVKFILKVLTAGSAADDRAVWIAPRLVRASSAVTATAAPTVTVTPSPTSSGVSGWNTFENTTYKFSFKFPPGNSNSVQSSADTTRVDLPVAAGTNLHEEYIDITATQGITSCKTNATGGAPSTSENITINGVQYLKETGGDAGAGNYYDWAAYSAVHGANCLSMTFVMHSVNPGNYSTPPATYDKAAQIALFEQIMATLGWQ